MRCLLPPANEVCEGYVFTGVLSVHRGVSVSVWRRVSLQVVSVQGGSLSRVVSIQGGVSVWGVSVQGGLCPGGSLSRGSLSRGVCQGDPPDRAPPPHTVTSGRYASYWNAFLFIINNSFFLFVLNCTCMVTETNWTIWS